MKSIDINFPISGTKIIIPFNAICSISNQRFYGNIIIEYHPKKKVIEFMDAEIVIENITKNKLMAEELAYKIFQQVQETINPQYLKILVDVQKSEAHQPVQIWCETHS
jgi:NADPH-dependent 7-cyano-7-deazaguanine reductase QueF